MTMALGMSDMRTKQAPVLPEERWHKLMSKTISGTPLVLPPAQWDALLAAYAKPARAYHQYAHVQEVARHFADVAAGPGWSRPREVWLAVQYHDAVYEVGRSDNESRSALLAREHIGCWLSGLDIDAGRVAELIELTARHGQHAPEDFGEGCEADDTRHFLDCDMAILGAAPEVFDAYDQAIAREYRDHVPGWLFRIHRRRFLKGLLKRERIFLSDFFHQRYSAQAQENLQHAISRKS